MESVSDYNLELHQHIQYPCTHANKDILTIAINGIPPDKREYEGFTFAKRFINYFPPGTELDQTEEFYVKRMKDANLETVLKELDAIVTANGNKVVFASHSNGSFFSTAYIYHHPTKVVGIIEFGCMPITLCMPIRIFGEHFIFNKRNTAHEGTSEDNDAEYEKYVQWLRDFIPEDLKPMTKYSMLAYCSILKTEVFR